MKPILLIFRIALKLGLFFSIWWMVVSIFDLPAYILPSPIEVFHVMNQNIVALTYDFWVTLMESFAGLLLAIFVSFLFLLLMFIYPKTRTTLIPAFITIKATPIIAFAPLAVIWFGHGMFSKVILSSLIAFFPLIIGAVSAIERIPTGHIDYFKSIGASRHQIFWMLSLPFALPEILSAAKIASTLAVVGAIVAEMSGADVGVGHTILLATYNIDTPLLIGAIFLSSSIGLILYFLVALCQIPLARFYYGYNGNRKRFL